MANPNTITLNKSINTGSGATTLSYPGDVASLAYLMSMHVVQYRRPIFSKPIIKPIANIYLPLPQNLQEEFNISWNERDLGILGNTFMENLKAGKEMLGGISSGADFRKMASQDKNAWKNFLQGQGPQMAGLLIQSFMPDIMSDTSVNALVSEATGIIPNPHMTAVFSGVKLREHTLSWTFSPRSLDDSKALDHLETAIKQYAHPAFVPNLNQYALEYPYQVFCNFIGSNYLYPIKRAVIRGIKIDNAGGGVPAFYGNSQGAPVTKKMTLQLMEVQILTRSDFEDHELNAYTPNGDYATGSAHNTDSDTGDYSQSFNDFNGSSTTMVG